MQFVFPTFLFALLALAIPIILHLFYFRRFKKVYFTNVKYLQEVKEETSARSKLRNLLVLLSRLLALAFLIFAFAQPFIPQENANVKKGQKNVSIFVDNSFSMSAESQDVPLLEKAKQRAREIVNAYSLEDRFQVITNDFEGRHQRLVSQEDILDLIDEITISPEVRDLNNVLDRQQQVLNESNSENKASYLISDFQKSISSNLSAFQDTSIDVNLIPLQAVQERNISIDSAWFSAPVQLLQQTNSLLVKVTNRGENDAENIRLSLQHEGQNKPIGTLSIPANSSVIDTANITILRTGWHNAKLAVTDYPIIFDDDYFISFEVAQQINVLVLNEDQPNPYLQAAFNGLSYFNPTNQNSSRLDYSKFKNYQLIILNELINISSGLAFELSQFVDNGGNLIVFPNQNANLSTYNSFLRNFPANELANFEAIERRVGNINTEEFIFNDVYENLNANLKLPTTQGNFRFNDIENRREERLLTYRDGNTYLAKYLVNQGHLYLCAAPLNETINDLVGNAEIFIPLLYKAAISSGQRKRIAYHIGQDEVIEFNHQGGNSDIVYKLKGDAEEFIPEQRIVSSKAIFGLGNQIESSGFYDLFLNPDTTLATFAFNFDRKESDLKYFNRDELVNLGEQFNIINMADNGILTAEIEQRSQGTVLWRWCIILVILFLVIESLLLRFWKV